MNNPRSNPQVIKHRPCVIIRQFWRIVVSAQMTQEQIPQPWMHEAPDRIAAGIVGQVASALADTHLEFVRVEAAEEHIDIEVGFHHHGFGLGGPGHGFFRDVTEVRHQDEEVALAADGVTDRLRGVMRDHKVLGLKAFRHSIPFLCLEVAPTAANLQPGKRMPGQGFVQDWRRIDGLGETLADGAEISDMVTVVVGDEDGQEAVKIQRDAFQDLFHPTDAHAGVDENARWGLPHLLAEKQVAVAATAAGKTQEANQFRSSSQYREITL